MARFALCGSCSRRFKKGASRLSSCESAGCFICQGALQSIPSMAAAAFQEASRFEWRTFSISSKFPKPALVRDFAVAGFFTPGSYTAIKNSANAAACLEIAKKSGKRCVQRNADMAFTFDFSKRSASAAPNPVYVHGHYIKLSRSHCQSNWHCSSCGGKGCGACGGSGHNYPSIEGEIGKVFCAAFGAQSCVLHASGREDVDVRALGTGRPFVLELATPKKRSADLGKIENSLLESQSVRANGLRLVRKGFIDAVCGSHFEKKYLALVSADRPLAQKDAKIAESLSGAMLSQQTPKRVLSRRSDIVRKRKVISVRAKAAEGGKISLEILAEAGTYIKEFINSDGGRTSPSVSALLGCQARCDELDVVEIRDYFLQTLPALSD